MKRDIVKMQNIEYSQHVKSIKYMRTYSCYSNANTVPNRDVK